MRSEGDAREAILREIFRSRPDLRRAVVEFTENGSTMVSRGRREGLAVLRLHRIFRDAPEDLLCDVVRFFFRRVRRATAREISTRMKEYIELHRSTLLRPFSLHRCLPPRGSVFDLREIADRVGSRFFPRLDPVDVAWSRHYLRRLMAKWIENPEPLPNLVLVNRLLDTPEVPLYYLEFLIFHEFLHEAMPVRRIAGRWVHHSPEFLAREREFPEYERARRWEKSNLERLYRSHRRRSRGTNGQNGKNGSHATNGRNGSNGTNGEHVEY